MPEKKGAWGKSLYTIVFMTFLTALFITVLSLLFLKTRPRIRVNESYDFKSAVLHAAGEETGRSGPEALIAHYDSSVEEKKLPEGKGLYYKVLRRDGSVSYVFPFQGPGLWGEIEGVLGYNGDLTEITGFDILKQNETPGLGGRITEAWFKSQFKGKVGPFTALVTSEEGRDFVNSFQAVTGATSTSAAVQSILNDLIRSSIEMLRTVPEEER
ncbi:MAG TPA: FMN-binding protein [Candidatus Mcinerneyibacteriales bacterium]|nr:FMN-binding protein [Candidatus Mcinerneyibacteriales bacterium]HPJ69682.1 FMN-binding protein [Candidatus Mcinerneyibacteriales bacterium]HPQ88800.1 FMN-binding protein [Candidatus Mcinerneyibacteriales bacterium]